MEENMKDQTHMFHDHFALNATEKSLYISWSLCWGFFFVNPGQPIWPMTPSLDRVNHWVGFQNYDFMAMWTIYGFYLFK
jgi:hypothetical protein